ncbi:MAG TPA: AMP-binding protein [Caulobacteraceae bacterium]
MAADAPQPMSLGARLTQLAGERGDRPAVSDQHRTVTWAELDRRTNRLARGLEAAGVRQGDLVTVGLTNSVDFVEACYALWKAGATPQPISYRLPAAEAEAVMALAKTPILIAGPQIESSRPRYDVERLLALSDDDSPVEDRAAPVYKAPTSGGSTGRPKLILSGSAGVYAPPEGGGGGYRTSGDDVMVMPGPLYHNGPFTSSFAGLNQGAHLVVLPRFDAEATLAAIDRHKGTWMYLVPTMMSRIWRLPDEVKARYDVSSLRTVWHLAAPCPPWLKEAWIGWLGPEVIMELYAGTEAQAVTVITGAEWLEHRGSVGKVAFGEMGAFDADGKRLPAGETGEIFMRRPEGSPASYRYLGAEARVLPDRWESLGDIGWFDEDGYLYLADRRADMILVGGSNVYPAEIEAALDEHPLVQSSAVIGLPDEDLGNLIHAIVQPRPGLTEEALREHVRDRLVTYKQPRSYEFVAENIRDDAGKVRRTQLRDERLRP